MALKKNFYFKKTETFEGVLIPNAYFNLQNIQVQKFLKKEPQESVNEVGELVITMKETKVFQYNFGISVSSSEGADHIEYIGAQVCPHDLEADKNDYEQIYDYLKTTPLLSGATNC